MRWGLAIVRLPGIFKLYIFKLKRSWRSVVLAAMTALTRAKDSGRWDRVSIWRKAGEFRTPPRFHLHLWSCSWLSSRDEITYTCDLKSKLAQHVTLARFQTWMTAAASKSISPLRPWVTNAVISRRRQGGYCIVEQLGNAHYWVSVSPTA